MNHNTPEIRAASIVFAAGKGSRMKGFDGNKTLLPLIPEEDDPYVGSRPMLIQVLEQLPPGPKGIVVHHKADEVRRATADYDCQYIFQPETNGTGGALLAARDFLSAVREERVIVTMGDVPLIRPDTYRKLLSLLSRHHMAVLAFSPQDPAQYGRIEMEGHRALRIVEWKYWSQEKDPEKLGRLKYCNAGVYGARKESLLYGMEELEKHPHEVQKERDGRWVTIREYFLTDLVEFLNRANRSVGVCLAEEEEVMGVDTPEALRRAQELYASTDALFR